MTSTLDSTEDVQVLFTEKVLDDMFPPEKANQFFEALYGGAEDGAFDIRLRFKQYDPARKTLFFELHLIERPGQCLACNLTYGLPSVFTRHPVIDIAGVVRRVAAQLGDPSRRMQWSLGQTKTISRNLHVIPLSVAW